MHEQTHWFINRWSVRPAEKLMDGVTDWLTDCWLPVTANVTACLPKTVWSFDSFFIPIILPMPCWNFSWIYFPNLLELSFIRVWALPKASSSGFTYGLIKNKEHKEKLLEPNNEPHHSCNDFWAEFMPPLLWRIMLWGILTLP